MSTVEEHFAALRAMKPREGGWMTEEFQFHAVLLLGAHLDELEAAWKAHHPEDTAIEPTREAAPSGWRDKIRWAIRTHIRNDGYAVPGGPEELADHIMAILATPTAEEVARWDDIPKCQRFGRRLTSDAVPHLQPGTLLRFYSSDPWFEPGEHMPSNGEIVVFTGNVGHEFPLVGPHLEVATLEGDTYPGGGWVFRLFQFVSDPVALFQPEGRERS